MVRDIAEFILVILTITGILIGAARWLLSVYYNQQRMLASFEKSRMDGALSSLNETVKTHSTKLQDLNQTLQATDKDLKYTNKHLIEVKEDLKELSKSTDNYTKGVEQRLSKLEVITENLSILRTPK